MAGTGQFQPVMAATSEILRFVPTNLDTKSALGAVRRYWRSGDQLYTGGVFRAEQPPAGYERLQRASWRRGIDCCQCLGGGGYTERNAVASFDHV